MHSNLHIKETSILETSILILRTPIITKKMNPIIYFQELGWGGGYTDISVIIYLVLFPLARWCASIFFLMLFHVLVASHLTPTPHTLSTEHHH